MVTFWGENKLTLLYKLHTDYVSLCQSIILSVLSHEEIYLNICRNVRDVITFIIHSIFSNLLSGAGIIFGCWSFDFIFSTNEDGLCHSAWINFPGNIKGCVMLSLSLFFTNSGSSTDHINMKRVHSTFGPLFLLKNIPLSIIPSS